MHGTGRSERYEGSICVVWGRMGFVGGVVWGAGAMGLPGPFLMGPVTPVPCGLSCHLCLSHAYTGANPWDPLQHQLL